MIREIIFYLGFYLLGTSINWPASLDLPTFEILPLIHEKQGYVFAGYYVYLLSQVIFIPIAVSLKMAYHSDNHTTNLLLSVGVGLTIASVCFKVLGIFRWLFALPVLAELAIDPNIQPDMVQYIELNYQLINAYAGKIGEHLGVQLFGLLVWGVFSCAILRTDSVPKAFAYWLMISAVLFIPLADMFHFDSGIYLTINGITYSLWAMTFGTCLVIKANE